MGDEMYKKCVSKAERRTLNSIEIWNEENETAEVEKREPTATFRGD